MKSKNLFGSIFQYEVGTVLNIPKYLGNSLRICANFNVGQTFTRELGVMKKYFESKFEGPQITNILEYNYAIFNFSSPVR